MLDLSANYIQALLWSTALWLAVPFLISLWTGKEQAFCDLQSREVRAINLGFWLFEAMALGPLLWLLSRYGLGAETQALDLDRPRDMTFKALNWVLGFLLALWLGDGLAAARHRLEHTRFFWRFHAWHHTVDASDWLQTHRHHPLSRLIAFFAEVILLALLLEMVFGTIPWLSMIAAMACRRAYAIWLHGGSDWGMNSHVARYLVLPGHHRAHHAGAPIYSGMFRHWDCLWSTEQSPERHRGQRIRLSRLGNSIRSD